MSAIGNRIRWFSMLAGLLVLAATHAFGQADAPVAASGTDDGKLAEELLALSRAPNGRVYIIEPARDQMLRTNGEQAGKVMLFFPEQQGAALTISLPVKTAGYYRIHARHVYGAWFQGRYGNYQLAADGVPMPGKCHGWYGPDGPPKHWPKAKTHLNDVDWGVVHLEPPHVDLAFRSADAGLLGVARILLEPVEPSQLTPEEKARRVPERRAEQAGGKPAKVLGSNSRFMEDISRYDARLRADKNQIQPASVTRQSYVDYIYPESTYGANAIRTGPDRAQYGVRHAFPALVHYDAKNDKELGVGIKRTLRLYGEKIRQTVKDEKWHSHYMHDPVLLCLYRKVFREHNDWSADDEQWFKGLYVFMCRTVHVWDTPPDYWRGPMHRSTGEAIMKLLAVKMYPDIPEAAAWAEYGRRQWQDWWDCRDNPINDINYFCGQVFPIAIGSHLLGREEVFTDPGMRKFWDRLIHMTTPDGAVIPFGPAWGWNSHAGERLMFLEIAAAHTGDGRYRFVAHRIFNYLLYQQEVTKTQHMLDHFSQLGVAVAYFLGDHRIQPIEPEAGSVLLHHAETLRVRDKEGALAYFQDLDPDPLKAQICCGLICTKQQLPFKLCLRSGWSPGDLYMLVDLFPRHEPMNVGGVLGMVRYNAPFTQGPDSKALTDWVNMFRVEDLSGTATTVVNPNPHTRDAYYMDVTVPAMKDAKTATYAVVRVKDYNGYPMTLEREFFFVKNRFCIVRDTARFRESFLARFGPNWLTQNAGPQIGDHWANTYFSKPYAFDVPHHAPPMDLLVYHAPHDERQLVIGDDTADVRRMRVSFTVQYVQEGVVEADAPYCFTHLLLPGMPTRNPVRSNAPGAASREDILGQYMAAGVSVLADNTEHSVWRIRSDEDREEWIVLNPAGKELDIAGLKTDARQAYIDLRSCAATRAFVLSGTRVTIGKTTVFESAQRTDHGE